MGIYGAQRAFFDPFARKFNFGATHFFKPYPFTSKFQSVSSASRGRPSFPALAPSLIYLTIDNHSFLVCNRGVMQMKKEVTHFYTKLTEISEPLVFRGKQNFRCKSF